MLVARAFVWSVSPRALLAVLALSLSVAYALVSAGSLAGLGGEGAALEEAATTPGWVLHDGGAPFDVARAPADATLVHGGAYNGTKVATVVPYPLASNVGVVGLYVEGVPDAAVMRGLEPGPRVADFVPPDHVLVPPTRFDALVPEPRTMALFAYVPGETPPDTSLAVAPWQGIAQFYEGGADQIRQGLVFVVLASGAMAALLAAGFAHLEVLARRADLATLEALAGRDAVRRVVAWRVVALVGVGLLLGTIGSLAAMRVAQLAVGADAFRIAPLALLATWMATGAGGALFGIVAGRQALEADHRSRSGGKSALARRFRAPGRLRFLVVTPRLFTAVFAATLVAGLILSVVAAASAVPVRLFGVAEGENVIVTGEGNPLRGTADRFLAENAVRIEGVDAAKAETYVPTVLKGRPMLVMGTDFDGWRAYDRPTLVAGEWPATLRDATIGARAARLLDIDPGDSLFLPSAYHRGGEVVEVTGIHRTGAFADDEVYVSLDIAGRLAGLAPDQVTLFRVRLDDTEVVWQDVAPTRGIEVVSLALVPANPPPLTPATVVVEAVNFAPTNASRSISVRLDGDVAARDTLRMGPHESVTRSYPIITPRSSVFRLEVNPVQDVPAGRSDLVIVAPPRATPGETFEVTVQDRDRAPVADAAVLLDGRVVTTTQANGNGFLRLDEPGLYVVGARSGDASAGVVVRAAPIGWNDIAVLDVERVFFGAERRVNDTHVRVDAEVTVANLGGVAANETLTWRVDGANATTSIHFVLDSATRQTFASTVTLPYGAHTVAIGDHDEKVAFEPPRAGGSTPPPDARPRTIEDVLEEKRRAAAAGGAGGPQDPVQAFLDKVFKSLDAAVTVVIIATVAHSGVLVWVAVVREVRERQGVVRQLHVLGAAGHQVEARALRDTVLSVVPPVLAAAIVAWLLLLAAAFMGLPAAFGHAVPADGAASVLVRTGAALLVVALGAAFYAVQSAGSGSRTAADTTSRTEADWLEALR